MSNRGGGFDQSAVAITGGNVPYVLAKSAIPFISVSSGTMGNNGAISALTGLPATYAGAYLWLPAGAIAAGVPAAAAWYWFVGSSTTAGTVYNSTYTTGQPVAGTTTAFATTGPGAFTGDTTEAFGPTITVPANALGVNGKLRIYQATQNTNNVNIKTNRVRYSGSGGTVFFSAAVNGTPLPNTTIIANRGATNSQIGYSFGAASATTASAIQVTGAIDTTAQTSVVISIQKATATDNNILDDFLIEVMQ